MHLADSNFWLALALFEHPLHVEAAKWMSSQKSARSVLFCRATEQSFLRLLSTAAVFAPYGLPPLTNAEAWLLYERLRADKRIGFADEPRGLAGEWKKFSARPASSPKLWMDAYLAAFAVAGKIRLVTTDTGFRQFKGLDHLILAK